MRCHLMICIFLVFITSGCAKTIKYQDFYFEEQNVAVSPGKSLRVAFDPQHYSEEYEGKYLSCITSGPYTIRAYLISENEDSGKILFKEFRVNGRKLVINEPSGYLHYNEYLKKYFFSIVLKDIDIEYHDADISIVISIGNVRHQMDLIIKTNYEEGTMSPLMRGLLSV